MQLRKKVGLGIAAVLLTVSSAYAYSAYDTIVKAMDSLGISSYEYGVEAPSSSQNGIAVYRASDNKIKLVPFESQGITLCNGGGQICLSNILQSSVSGLEEGFTNVWVVLNAKASSTTVSTLQTQVNNIQTTVNTMSSSSPVITNGVTRSIVTSTTATGTMLSSTKTTNVMYSINIGTTATIGGNSDGSVVLETSPTNTSTSTWTVVNEVRNGQSISLAIALQSVQNNMYVLMGNIPAGYYVRVRSINNSGTPTYSWSRGQEMQF